MMVRFFGEAADRLDPTDARRQEPQWWSVESSTVVCSWLSTFGQLRTEVASEGEYLSCGKPLRADIWGRYLIRLMQNLSFVIVPLKIDFIGAEMSPWERMLAKPVREPFQAFWLASTVPC
jgi:hypothetical protein